MLSARQAGTPHRILIEIQAKLTGATFNRGMAGAHTTRRGRHWNSKLHSFADLPQVRSPRFLLIVRERCVFASVRGSEPEVWRKSNANINYRDRHSAVAVKTTRAARR